LLASLPLAARDIDDHPAVQDVAVEGAGLSTFSRISASAALSGGGLRKVIWGWVFTVATSPRQLVGRARPVNSIVQTTSL
jgi:hypothetical protein